MADLDYPITLGSGVAAAQDYCASRTSQLPREGGREA
jgi:hypothetical protein